MQIHPRTIVCGCLLLLVLQNNVWSQEKALGEHQADLNLFVVATSPTESFLFDVHGLKLHQSDSAVVAWGTSDAGVGDP